MAYPTDAAAKYFVAMALKRRPWTPMKMPHVHTQPSIVQLISLNWNPVNQNFRKWVGCEA